MNRVSRRIFLLLFGCLIGFAMGHIYYTRQSCDPAKVVLSHIDFVAPFEVEKRLVDIRAYPCRWYHFRWGQ